MLSTKLLDVFFSKERGFVVDSLIYHPIRGGFYYVCEKAKSILDHYRKLKERKAEEVSR